MEFVIIECSDNYQIDSYQSLIQKKSCVDFGCDDIPFPQKSYKVGGTNIVVPLLLRCLFSEGDTGLLFCLIVIGLWLSFIPYSLKLLHKTTGGDYLRI